MEGVMSPREAARFIAENSADVSLIDSGVVKLAKTERIPIIQPSFYATISEETLKHIFRSDSAFDIPLLDRRLQVLLEAGRVLMEKFQGSFVNVIEEANKSAQSLLKIVLNNFTSFQDVAEYNGKKVGFYKRAQILIGDIWGCCEGQGLGEFTDIDTITMFADYRIPQALVYFGVLQYSDSLMSELKKGKVFQSGDKQEVEIRGVSLWACELVRDEILGLIKELESQSEDGTSLSANAVLVDHYLWDIRRELADEMADVPFHRCRGIFY
ncbi:hypothetical protein Btru_027969 [Bulinus truncatus]|nr:hypothetical protein Btru_027969 [Bulinus truncatus]